MADGAAIRLPRILVAGTGHNGISPPPGLDAGILLRNTDLAALIDCALSGATPPAVELDSIRGLGSDDAAVDFLRRKLSIEIMLNAANLNMVAFAHHLQSLGGQVVALFVIAIAAGEAAVGLALRRVCELRVGGALRAIRPESSR